MKNTHLKDFCTDKSQIEAAEIIGCTQGAISQMLKAGREVFIVLSDDKAPSWYEVKRRKRGDSSDSAKKIKNRS